VIPAALSLMSPSALAFGVPCDSGWCVSEDRPERPRETWRTILSESESLIAFERIVADGFTHIVRLRDFDGEPVTVFVRMEDE